MLESLIKRISPAWAVKRLQSKQILAAYEAARYDRTRTGKIDNSSGDLLTQKAANNLHGFARHLEQNVDFCESIILSKVNNVIGAKGIVVEPMPLSPDGKINSEFKKVLQRGWADWCKKPDVTGEESFAGLCKKIFRRQEVDGECFVRELIGNVGGVKHASAIPYSLQIIERDLCPLDYTDQAKNIYQGIQRNEWGKPIAYYFYKNHPQDIKMSGSTTELIRVPAERIKHFKIANRINQSRGITRFATIIKSLEWIGSYLRSESVSALIASFYAFTITKGSSELYDPNSITDGKREISLDTGAFIDDLLPGEKLELLANPRPNSNSVGFVDMITKFVAGATGVDWSNATNSYEGNYPSRRAARLDSQKNYDNDAQYFIEKIEEIYRKHVEIGLLAGVYQIAGAVDPLTLYDANFYSPVQPDLDPVKSANARAIDIENHVKSTPYVIRECGLNPDEMLEQEAEWQAKLKERGLIVDIKPMQENQANQDNSEDD